MPDRPTTADDYGFRGFFELRTPQDLFRKLRHDYGRLSANPLDSYAAFDFFVTANCLVDWSWPSATAKQQKANRRAETIPRVCEHLADGAMHFLLTREHRGVKDTTVSDGPFDPAIFDPRIFHVPALMVRLETDEARELGGDEIDVLDLAARVLAYWERRGVGGG